MKLISRKEAVDSGLKFYFTGVPCVRGHIAKRYTAKSYCLECSRESAIESQQRNKQRKRDNQAIYAKKNRDKIYLDITITRKSILIEVEGTTKITRKT